MKYGYREVRRISAESMRGLCISKGWYTRGTSEDYRHLLVDLVDNKENITTDDIVEIATDVIEHSNTAQEFESVCFDIARIAITFFEEV